jgi:hypothetical protein
MKVIKTSVLYTSKWVMINVTWVSIYYINLLEQWCANNGTDGYCYACGGGFMFEDERDAVLFALKWS